MFYRTNIIKKSDINLTFRKKMLCMAFLGIFISLLLSPKLIVSAENKEGKSSPYNFFLPIAIRAGNSYYVSPQGNNNNPGTIIHPWRTIRKAASMVEPGDVVYIRDGVYQESVNISTSGTGNAPIYFQAYPGENPVIDGNNFTIPDYDWGPLLTISGNYIRVSGVEVRYSRGMGVVLTGSFVVADNIYSHHNKENGILISRGHYSSVKNSLIWRNALSNEFGQGNNHSSGLSAARNGVTHARISHNIVWENWGEGVSSFEADNITIEDNIVHDNYTANIYISDSTYVICQSNFIYIDPTSYIFPYGEQVGIMLGDELYAPPSANLTIINNIASGNRINLYWWQGSQGGGMNNVLIANNSFVNSIATSNIKILRGDHQNVEISNNIIQQDGQLLIIIVEQNPDLSFNNNLWSKTPPTAASGVGDVIGDPLLTHNGDQYSPEWYILTSFSPAIDGAFTLPEVEVDYFGNSREAIPDIGANEFFPY